MPRLWQLARSIATWRFGDGPLYAVLVGDVFDGLSGATTQRAAIQPKTTI